MNHLTAMAGTSSAQTGIIGVWAQAASWDGDEAVLKRDVGIRFNGTEKTNVEEYSVSEGWVRVAAGKARDRKGNPLTIKLKGTVEPYYKG